MHLTIRKYRKVEGDRKQIVEIVNREFVPLLSKIDGFSDFYAFFADDGTLVPRWSRAKSSGIATSRTRRPRSSGYAAGR